MAMKKKHLMHISFLVGIVLTSCSPVQTPITDATSTNTAVTVVTPASEATNTPQGPIFTRIIVDGRADDWADYAVIGSDAVGDHVAGSPDLAEVRAFNNNEYFYLFIGQHEYGITDHYDILIDIDGGDFDHQLSVWPERNRALFTSFPLAGDMQSLEGVTVAGGEIIEVKMPLAAIGDQPVRRVFVQTYLGDQVGDLMADMQPLITNELEMTMVDLFAYWLSMPFEGAVSSPFIITSDLDGARGLEINSAEADAYVVGEFPGTLWQIDINPNSVSFGKVTLIATDLLIPNDLALGETETLAYISREAGPKVPPTGRNVITRVDLETGLATLVSDRLGQPTNIHVVNETIAYVVDLQRGGLYQLALDTGDITLITGNLTNPFAFTVNKSTTLAYVVTEPARAGNYPHGDLLLIDLQSRQVTHIADDAIWGATGIILNADETIAILTEFGSEVECSGEISAFNVNPTSADYGNKTILVSGLCGAHDLRLNHAETLLYFVEVEKDTLSVVHIDWSKKVSEN